MFEVAIMMIIMAVPITGIITTHQRKMARIKQETIEQEIELEKLKQQNYIAETENLRLELEQKKLTFQENFQKDIDQ
ncbi:MAG TPA: hypothetical protein VK120_00505 [Sporosarcina sp.]|nr:hypothetical protein [Sporosarcina sp.]